MTDQAVKWLILAVVLAAPLQFLLLFVLALGGFRERRDHRRQVDRLLLLGKSSSPGEAIAAIEKLDRLERAKHELMEQRVRARVRGADQPEVARNDSRSASWWGFKRRPKPRAEG